MKPPQVSRFRMSKSAILSAQDSVFVSRLYETGQFPPGNRLPGLSRVSGLTRESSLVHFCETVLKKVPTAKKNGIKQFCRRGKKGPQTWTRVCARRSTSTQREPFASLSGKPEETRTRKRLFMGLGLGLRLGMEWTGLDCD